MGLVERMQSYGKKQRRKLLWRIKAAIHKAFRTGSKQQFKFRYDPKSYALNFDDGCHQQIGRTETDSQPEFAIWVFVWVD